MMLQKKTILGTLMTRYKPDETYPGFWVDIKTNNKETVPICNVEYDPDKNCIQIVVYGDADEEDYTEIIEIKLKKNQNGGLT
jgi:hypothetical protein